MIEQSILYYKIFEKLCANLAGLPQAGLPAVRQVYLPKEGPSTSPVGGLFNYLTSIYLKIEGLLHIIYSVTF